MKARSFLCIAGALGFTAPLSATIIGFVKLSNNAPENVAAQLTVDVTDPGGNQVDFTFYNDVGIPSSITDIYFDDGSLLGISTIFNSDPGVDFEQGASPSNLPNGNLATPPFQTTAGFSADSNPPAAPNGVNSATEWVTIRFDLINGKTVVDTLAAFADGSLRIGLHVQAIGANSDSDAYITPEPATGLLVLLGLSAVALRRRRSA